MLSLCAGTPSEEVGEKSEVVFGSISASLIVVASIIAWLTEKRDVFLGLPSSLLRGNMNCNRVIKYNCIL